MVIAISAFSIGLFSQETPESLKEIPRDHIRIEKDVVYAVADGHKLRLDIAYPDNLPGKNKDSTCKGNFMVKCAGRTLARGAIDLPDLSTQEKRTFRQDIVLTGDDLVGNEILWNFQVEVFDSTLEERFEYLRAEGADVVDVRFNMGGYDENSILIANRFADRRRLTFTIRAVCGEGFTEKQEFYSQPQGKFQFTGPTFLLTSERTVSAAEIFVICVMACRHETRVGGTTAGALSAALTMHLPNGWQVEMSNEVCKAADGRVYEGIGIPPQVDAPVFVPEISIPV